MKTDEELMILYQNNDIQAFEVLYHRHKSRVLGFIALKTQKYSNSMKEEIFQKVFIKLHQNKELYNPSSPFLPWFFTLIKHTLIDHIRSEKSFEPFNEQDELASPSDQDNFIDLDERIEKISNSLSETEQLILYEKFVAGRSYQELEALFDRSASNLRKQVSRLIKRLKGEIQNEK